jgi:sec-independent protein translocase protein TatA
MDFFGMGFGEILLILFIVLILFGPDKIVGIAKTLGKFANSIKKASSEITTQINREIQEEEKAAQVALAKKDKTVS